MIAGRAALLIALCGCPGPARQTAPTREPVTAADDDALLSRLRVELEDDILASYEREDPPELDTGMISPQVGAVRIGAGPGDVYFAGDLVHPPPRWPLDLEPGTRTDVRSKRLEIHIAADQSAAWMADELSWRITLCGRSAVIPLRITALYAHDGDRWVQVVEHLSFGWVPTPPPAAAGKLPRSKITTAVVSGDLRDELSGVLGRGLLRTPHDAVVAATDPGALVIGPDIADEWHGGQVMAARVPAGRLDDRRVGSVGRSLADATIAYWVGDYTADIPARPGVAAGKVRMRTTHVFEKRRTQVTDRKDVRTCGRDVHGAAPPADCRWMLVQSHMSQPITDDELTSQVFGTALKSPKPLTLECGDGVLSPPEAALRPAAGSLPGQTR